MIDGRHFFDQPVKNNLITGLGNDYMNGCLLDYNYFNNYYKMIPIDLSKQQALDADPKAMQRINFTANLHRAVNITIFLIIEEAKETISDFLQGTAKVL